MDDILTTLYYTELEESENRVDKTLSEQSLSAYQALLGNLSDEQKSLFFVYEEKHNAANSDHERAVYCRAFKTAFRLAFDILKNE